MGSAAPLSQLRDHGRVYTLPGSLFGGTMRLCTLSETCQLFGVGESTLRRWIRRSGLILAVDGLDYRRRLVTCTQIRRLAAHSRQIVVLPDDDLARRVAALEEVMKHTKKPPIEKVCGKRRLVCCIGCGFEVS